MSEAEEMLLATGSRSRHAPDQAKAASKPSAIEGLSSSEGQQSKVGNSADELDEKARAPKPTSPTSRPAHEGDHVRNARLSTSDARKADHEMSSRIVDLSSSTVCSSSALTMLAC